MAGSSAAATKPTAALTGFICARLRARCSENSAGCVRSSPPPHSKASIRPTRTACSPNWKPSRKTSATPSRAPTQNLKRRSSAMADPVLKFPAEQKGPPLQPDQAAATKPRSRGFFRKYRRFLLLVVLPLVAVIGGLAFYLTGGRYVTTDDAYVGAQKVVITPDISGHIEKVVVREGQ